MYMDLQVAPSGAAFKFKPSCFLQLSQQKAVQHGSYDVGVHSSRRHFKDILFAIGTCDESRNKRDGRFETD